MKVEDECEGRINIIFIYHSSVAMSSLDPPLQSIAIEATDNIPDLATLRLDDDDEPGAEPDTEEYIHTVPLTSTEPDEELERFRRDWKRDLDSRLDGKPIEVPLPGPTRSSVPVETSSRGFLSTTNGRTPPYAPLVTRRVRGPHDQEEGVRLYGQAVEAEQEGRLNDALMLYRRAFKLDGGSGSLLRLRQIPVDRLYARSVKTLPEKKPEAAPARPTDQYSFQTHLQLQPDYISNPTRVSPLTALLRSSSVTDSTPFLPADESHPVHLAKLPTELFDHVFAYLDVASIERFGLVCKRARWVSANTTAWKRVTERLWAVKSMTVDSGVVGRYGGEWRTGLIEEERVRMDGCYIAVCHYV